MSMIRSVDYTISLTDLTYRRRYNSASFYSSAGRLTRACALHSACLWRTLFAHLATTTTALLRHSFLPLQPRRRTCRNSPELRGGVGGAVQSVSYHHSLQVSHYRIASVPRKVSPGRQFTGKNPPARRPRERDRFLPVNCRPGKTFPIMKRIFMGPAIFLPGRIFHGRDIS